MSQIEIENAVHAVQASQLPSSLDSYVASGGPFEFFQWAHPDAPTGERIDIYRMEIVDHILAEDGRSVLDLTLNIKNKDTGEDVDLAVTRLSNGRYGALFNGQIKDFRDLPSFLDAEADLPRRPPPVRTFLNIHNVLKTRIEAKVDGIKTSFEDEEPETGYKL